jgi:hypothetical protein
MMEIEVESRQGMRQAEGVSYAEANQILDSGLKASGRFDKTSIGGVLVK